MKTKIYYSVENGGDGSAYPQLMESEELAEIDQEFMGEYGWAEPCTGWITIESETPIRVVDEVLTVDKAIKEVEEELDQDYMKDYKKCGKYPDWFERLESKLKALKQLKEKGK